MDETIDARLVRAYAGNPVTNLGEVYASGLATRGN